MQECLKCIALLVLLISVYSQKDIGDDCTLPENKKGVCTLLTLCQKAKDDLKQNIHPQNCGFKNNDPIVCCEISLAKQKCLEYAIEVKPFQVFSIVGGTDADFSEYPHMAALGYGDINNIEYQYGGSLISHKFVLTAAHCLKSPILGPVKVVRLGDIRLEGSSQVAEQFEVVRSIPHPDYKPPSVYHDIGLLELNRPVFYKVEIKPSCLHTESVLIPETLWGLKATGWGLTQFGGSGSKVLQKVTLELFTNEECRELYRINPRRMPKGIVDAWQICAGGKNKEKDTCQGDSGGPLQVYRSEGIYGIVGVTSFGISCGNVNVPGVYTRVSYYVPWIESVVWASGKDSLFEIVKNTTNYPYQ